MGQVGGGSEVGELASAEVRGALGQRALRAVTRLPPEQRRRVEAALPEDVRAAIETSSRIGYVTATHHLNLLEAFAGELSEDEQRALWADAMVSTINSSLLHFGRRAFAKWGRQSLRTFAPRIWSLLLKGCGKLDVTQADDLSWTSLEVRGVPVEVATSRAFQVSVTGSLEGAMELVGLTPDVEVDAGRTSAGVLRIVMRAPPI